MYIVFISIICPKSTVPVSKNHGITLKRSLLPNVSKYCVRAHNIRKRAINQSKTRISPGPRHTANQVLFC